MEAGRYEAAIAAFEAYAEDETYAAGAQETFTASADKGGNLTGCITTGVSATS